MQILINITFTLALMFWPIMFMMSPMMLDAPGSENDRSHISVMMLVLCYPIGLFILLWIFGGNYFGFSGFKLTFVSSLIIVSAFSLFGYFGMLFNLHKGISNSGYSVADNNVYYSAKLIEGADSQSFKFLDNDDIYSDTDYAIDRDNLYYRGKIVEDANIENLKKLTIHRDTYWLNNTQVIYDGRVLTKALPGNFSGFDDYDGWTASDNEDHYIVFSYGIALPTVDKDTFTPLNDFMAKDRLHIFEKNKQILTGADAATFRLFEDHNFASDKNHIYYLATKAPFSIDGADIDSFEILDRGYLKDKTSVYKVHQYESIEKLPLADARSFEATQYDDANRSEARDINHYYYDGKIVGDR